MSAGGEALPSGQLYRTAWWFYLALAIAGVLWIGSREDELPLGLFLDPATWWLDLAIGLGTGLAIVAAWRLAVRVLPALGELEDRLRGMLGTIEPSAAISLAIISGFAEELFFRGAMQGAWGPVWATLIFGLLHTGPGRPFRAWTVFALLAGAVMAALTVWRGNILAAVVTHMVVNGVNLTRLATTRPAESRQGTAEGDP